MSRRLLILLPLLASLPLTAQAADPVLETEEEKTIYAIGMAIASRFQVANFNLSADELDIMMAGLKDAASGADPRVELAEYGPKIQAFAQARASAAAAGEKEGSEEFLADMRAAAGAEVFESGLIYFETQAGDGPSPTATDTVNVHYHGTLRDGTVFDSSKDRGQPISFALNRVIPCWTEGVQKMKVGGKATLVCPSDIAYGDTGAGGLIKPGAALKFEVELLAIE